MDVVQLIFSARFMTDYHYNLKKLKRIGSIKKRQKYGKQKNLNILQQYKIWLVKELWI